MKGCVTEAYTRGFVEGQADTYCEQVLTGAKFAAEMGCAKEQLPDVQRVVTERGCKSMAKERGLGRVSVWIFKDDFARQLLTEYVEGGVLPKAAATWFMGKLFGYSDDAIASYIKEHGLFETQKAPR